MFSFCLLFLGLDPTQNLTKSGGGVGEVLGPWLGLGVPLAWGLETLTLFRTTPSIFRPYLGQGQHQHAIML